MSIPERPVVPVARPRLRGREGEYLDEMIRSGWLSSHGPWVGRFEEAFARSLGVRHAVAVMNGTASIHLALEALGIGEGDEVIVPAFAMAAPAFAVRYTGATPVPVDADETWNLAADAIEAAVTRRTRAIIAVHTYGHPSDMEAICAVAGRLGLPVIEDAAEAHGGTVRGRAVGTWGDIACFSFYANKLITSGEGGILVTHRSDLADRARWKRSMCFGADEESRYTHREIGFNYRMTSMQAAVGLAQLDALDEALADQLAVAAAYDDALAGLPGIELPPRASWATNVYWVYGVLVDESRGATRAEVQARLARDGIETRRFFTPLHRQPFMARAAAWPAFPRADDLYARGFYLPSGSGIGVDVVDRVSRSLHQALRGAGRTPEP